MTRPWWQYPNVGNIGSPDREGGFPKPDINFLVPGGTPITALGSGTITSIDRASPWGNAVTIRLDNPLNGLATHEAYLHLDSIPFNLMVGSHLNAGDILGTGGNGGHSGAPPGFALYNGDVYGYGIAWNTLMQNLGGLLNPFNAFNGSLLNALTPSVTGNPINPLTGLPINPNGILPINPATGLFDFSSLGIIGDVINGILGGIQNSFAPVQTYLTSATQTIGWLSNPLRIAKLLGGLVLVLASGLLFLAPTGQKLGRDLMKEGGLL